MATLTSPSLGKLITNVRNFLNSPNPNNSFWTDAELTEYLNEGVRLYFSEIVQLGEGQFTTKSTLDITSGVETVALPTDCFIIKAVRKKVSDGWAILSYQNDITGSYSTSGGTAADTFFPTYYFRGNSLVLRPTPNFTEVGGLEVEYMQNPDVLVSSGDLLTAQVAPVFKNLIEMYGVYKAKLKQSLVNGVNMHAIAEENLAILGTSFKDAISRRSSYPTYVIPFDPENS